MENREISVDDYFNNQRLDKNTKIVSPVRQTNKLPYHEIDWKDFEYLCAKLARLKYSIVRIFLGSGQKQDGIDIFCYQTLEAHEACIQCKKHKKFTPSALRDAVKEFIDGQWANTAKEFIVCIKQETHENKKITEEYVKQRKILIAKGIELKLWDGNALDDMLRNNPEIVYEFFDRGAFPNWVRSFCGDLLAERIINSQKNVPEPKNYLPVNKYIKRYYKITHSTMINDDNQSKYWDVETLLKGNIFRNAHFLIRSTAGTGKTINLQHLAGSTLSKDHGFFPVFIKLKNFTGKDDYSLKTLLTSEVKHWQNAPAQKLVLLMDGLDEASEHLQILLKQQINQLSSEFPNSTIFVSTRSNQFQLSGNENELDGFHTLRLLPLDKKDIMRYITENSIDSSIELYNVIEKTSLAELAEIPFYLKHLVDIYNEKKTIPKTNKEFFEQLLYKVNDVDRNHFRFNEDILPHQRKRIKSAQKLALVMSLMGVRHLKEDDVIGIFDDKHIAVLKKYFIIICGDSPDYNWEFVHNNFQEYLTARVLATLHVDQIKRLITFNSSFTVVKPKWRNILTLLIDSFDQDDSKGHLLIDWLIDKQPVALLKVETQNLNTDKRLLIFKKIFNYYKEIGIYLHHTDYSAESLVGFVGESKELVKFLYEEMNNCLSEDLLLAVYDALIEYNWRFFDFNALITQKTHEVLKDKTTSLVLALRAIQLELKNTDNLPVLIQFVRENCLFVNRHDFCTKVYHHLCKIGESENYVDFLLEGLEKYEKRITEDGAIVIQSEYELLQCLDNITTPSALLKMAEKFITCISSLLDDGEFDICTLISPKFQLNAANAYQEEPMIFDKMIELLELLDKKNLLAYSKQVEFTSFFKESGTCSKAFNILLKKSNSDISGGSHTRLFCYVADDETLKPLIEGYSKKEVDESVIRLVISGLIYFGKNELLTSYYNELISINSNFFTPPDNFDWNSYRKEQLQGDILLLVDRKKFVTAIQEVFDIIGKHKISMQDTIELRGKVEDIDIKVKNTIALSVIREFVHKDKLITTEKAVRWSEDNENWNWYVVRKLCQYLIQEIPLSDDAINILKNWFFSNLPTVSFTSAVNEKDGTTFVDTRASLIVSIYKNLNLEIPEKTKLDMLSFDFSGFSDIPVSYENKNTERLSNIIINSVQNNEIVKQQIISNLRNGINASSVLENHIRICQELKINAALPFVCKAILNQSIKYYNTIRVIDIYIELGGIYRDLLPIIESEYLSQEWHHDFAKKLVHYHKDETIAWIVNGLKSKPYTTKNYIPSYSLLIELGHFDGVEHLVNWIKVNKSLPDRSCLNDFSKYDPFVVLPLLMDLLKEMYLNKFINDTFTPNSLVVDAGFSMVGEDEIKFEFVKDEFRQFITNHKSTNSEVVKLEYSIERHVTNYFLRKPERLTLNEAIRIETELMP